MELYDYKGYRYYLGDTRYTIFDNHGMTVKSDEINSEAMHKRVHAIIDGLDKNEVESVITITHNKDGTFDVLSNGVQIGWFKLMPHEVFLCFSGKGIYDNTQKKGFREMMKYFEDLSKEKA